MNFVMKEIRLEDQDWEMEYFKMHFFFKEREPSHIKQWTATCRIS